MNAQEATRQWGIALTGGIACGKSTIAAILRQHGYLALDADAMSRAVVAPGTEGLAAVAQTFGADIIDADGTMNRAKMRSLVFQDPAQRVKLEAIIHPRLQAEVETSLRAAGLLDHPRIWFYEASLIYERQREADFRAVWAAFAPVEIQISRVMQRDRCTRDMAEAILAAQMPAQSKAARADLVIDTNCPLPELEERVRRALGSLA